MEINNDLLVNLNLFRNKLIVKIQEKEIDNLTNKDILQEILELKNDLRIELMNDKIDKEQTSILLEDISSLCFILHSKLQGE